MRHLAVGAQAKTNRTGITQHGACSCPFLTSPQGKSLPQRPTHRELTGRSPEMASEMSARLVDLANERLLPSALDPLHPWHAEVETSGQPAGNDLVFCSSELPERSAQEEPSDAVWLGMGRPCSAGPSAEKGCEQPAGCLPTGCPCIRLGCRCLARQAQRLRGPSGGKVGRRRPAL